MIKWACVVIADQNREGKKNKTKTDATAKKKKELRYVKEMTARQLVVVGSLRIKKKTPNKRSTPT